MVDVQVSKTVQYACPNIDLDLLVGKLTTSICLHAG